MVTVGVISNPPTPTNPVTPVSGGGQMVLGKYPICFATNVDNHPACVFTVGSCLTLKSGLIGSCWVLVNVLHVLGIYIFAMCWFPYCRKSSIAQAHTID